MTARIAKIITPAALVLTFCLVRLQTAPAHSKNSNLNRSRRNPTHICLETPSRPALTHFIDKTCSSTPAGQPLQVSRLTPSREGMRTRIQEAYGKLPLSFEPNQGQTEARVKFVARGSGYSLFVTPQEAILALNRSRVPRPRNWGL
jgi:hypothetical protein